MSDLVPPYRPSPSAKARTPRTIAALLLALVWLVLAGLAVWVKHRSDNPDFLGERYDATPTLVLLLIIGVAATVIVGAFAAAAPERHPAERR